MFAEAEEIYAKSSRPITPMAYASDADGCTVPYKAPRGHPLHHAVQRAERLLAVHEYTRQAATAEAAAENQQSAGDAAANRPPAEDATADIRLPASDAPADTRRPAKDAPDLPPAAGEAADVPPPKPGAPAPGAIHEARARAMAEILLVGSEKKGWRTRAVWERNEPVLLPTADEVQIGSEVCPWSALGPRLTVVPDLSPPRWSATHWPPRQPTPNDGTAPR